MKKQVHHKTFFIINPTAGGKNISAYWNNTLLTPIKKQFPKSDFAFTQKVGHASLLTAKALKEGYKRIICVGGDGTLNEVINGFFKNNKPINPRAALGIIPSGSGGDFVRSLGIKHDIIKALRVIKKDRTKKIDVGHVSFKNKNIKPRLFINIAEAGLGAIVMTHVNNKNRKLPALYRYLSGTLQGFANYKNIPVTITLSHRPIDPSTPRTIETNLTNLVIANGQYFGRGMRPAPKAKLDDGLFDVIVIKDLNWLKFLSHFPEIYKQRKKIASQFFQTFQTAKITIKPLSKSDTVLSELDGENYGKGEMSFEILPKALKIIF
ncbi:MAG: diacylglycerol kinase family protein [bacterium]